MSLFGTLGSMVENAAAQQGGLHALFSQGLASAGGYEGVLAKLNEAGLGNQVSSWLGSGNNLPVSAEQIQAALGNAQLKQLAASFGVPVDQVAGLLAQHLPAAVNEASPNGTITPATPATAPSDPTKT